MRKPNCRLCGHPHLSHEPHVFGKKVEPESREERHVRIPLKRTMKPLVKDIADSVVKIIKGNVCPTCGRPIGRPDKRYATAAEKQRAYRERKKAKG